MLYVSPKLLADICLTSLNQVILEKKNNWAKLKLIFKISLNYCTRTRILRSNI